MWWLFKKKKVLQKEHIVSIPETKRHVFSQLATIIANPSLISNVCQLNYNYIQLSHLELEVLNQIESRSGQKIVGHVSNVLNRPLNNKQLSGWRFKYKNEYFDIFKDKEGTYFIGQSDKPNHLVFTLSHEYDGNILSSGPKYEYEILFQLVEDCLFNKLLDTPYVPKYSIDLESMQIKKIFS